MITTKTKQQIRYGCLNPGIYLITNTTNDMIYIGSSNNITERWKAHIDDLKCGRHHNRLLQSDWIECGENAFTFEIVWEAPLEIDRNELFFMEKLYIEQHNPEYNLAEVQYVKHNYNLKELADGKSNKPKRKLKSIKKPKKINYRHVTNTLRNRGKINVGYNKANNNVILRYNGRPNLLYNQNNGEVKVKSTGELLFVVQKVQHGIIRIAEYFGLKTTIHEYGVLTFEDL